MPPGPRRPDYDFEPFFGELEERNWYGDDRLLQRLLARYADEPDAGALRRWGASVSGRLRRLAEESARPENRPRLEPFDARGRRVNRIVLPASTRAALAAVEGGEGLGAVSDDPHVHYAKLYLYAQNGEAGVACSAACTDGLVRTLEAHGDRDVHRRAVEDVRGSTEERVVHGAQFVTEIQGGSDVPANRTRAAPDGDAYRLSGQKWFCSNVNADWYLVTARPEPSSEGRGGVGLFLVPARLPGNGEGTGSPGGRPDTRGSGENSQPIIRNGHTVDRLKHKMGTRELATAEVTFRGARAWPVGPPAHGLKILLRHVLVPSRYACVLFAASALRRAERIAGVYAEFREAFGRPIADYPRVAASLERIRSERRRALASAFRLVDLWEEARATDGWDEPSGVPEAERTQALDFRIMLSLCKAEMTRRATRLVHEAMTTLGGNGIEEAFSPLPRLYRDSVIMETWEGPHNVLLKQALRDLDRFGVDPDAFTERVAGGSDPGLASRLGRTAGIVAEGEADPVAFGDVAEELVTAFGRETLRAAGAETADGRQGAGGSA